LFLYIGEVPVYSQNFSSLSPLDATSYESTTQSSTSFLSVPSLSTATVSTVLQKVRADFSVSVTSLELKFKCNAA
jgi:hypothetical protein